MTLTVKDASRAYRQRRADRIQRYEAALKAIVYCQYADHDFMRDIARQALAPTTSQERVR